MTIIVGILCDAGIVMASDSQTTAGSFKRCDTNKLHAIDFKNDCACIGEAGSATLSSRAVVEMAMRSGTERIKDARTVPRLAQQAMRVARSELRAQNFGCPANELNQIIKALGDCSWLVGHFVKREPMLHRLAMSAGVEFKIRSQYAAIGSERELAEYNPPRALFWRCRSTGS